MIYCIEDDPAIRNLMLYALKGAGLDAMGFESAESFWNAWSETKPQMVMIDIMLPGEDGLSVLRKLRTDMGSLQVPVIITSAKGEEYDKVHGFDLGVDDYVVKPFSSKELMMRIHAILKRTRPAASSGEIYRLKDMEIDYGARTVTIRNQRVNLSPKEYELLVYLVRNAGIALTREQILHTVWGYDFYGDDRTLDTHIKLLRKNLGNYSSYIVTLRGVGYRFEKEEQS